MKTIFSVIMLFSMSILGFSQTGKMILVEGGSFDMGSSTGDADEKPVHKVTLSSFYICEHELTVSEYMEYTAAAGKKMPNPPDDEWLETHPETKKFYTSPTKKWWGWKENYPMHNVTWYDAIDYCNWRSQKEGLEKCYSKNEDGGWDCDLGKKGYRLPTESEWEFAARGGKLSSGFAYAGSGNSKEVAWYDETTLLSGPKAIKQKKANELGLYDMSGNVWEWCNDYYTKDYYKYSNNSTNPMNSKAQPYRVIRSGGWHYQGSFATITSRDGPEATYTNYNYGFRLARSK